MRQWWRGEEGLPSGGIQETETQWLCLAKLSDSKELNHVSGLKARSEL